MVCLAGAAVGLRFSGLRKLWAGSSPPDSRPIELVSDPDGILDLPANFSYRVISRVGDPMEEGLVIPGAPDGMAAFAGTDGLIIVVRNHELSYHLPTLSAFGANNKAPAGFDRNRLFDEGRESLSIGGTTTFVYDPGTRLVERCWMSLAGTELNCCGGPTPWGSWLSCEESVEQADSRHAKDHGWVFEVPAKPGAKAEPIPLTGLGRFMHEAAAVDPQTGIVYLTEDRFDGLFYRFVPSESARLRAGGRLQALALTQWPGADTRNWHERRDSMPTGRNLAVNWIDLTDTASPQDDLRLRGFQAGAALFARGEGLWWGRGEGYFCCTAGGPEQCGQVFRYSPSPFEGTRAERETPGTLSLFVEADPNAKGCDNIIATPWGDLFVCQDIEQGAALIGIRPDGSTYRFAAAKGCKGELAGATFSPDGQTLFVNIQWCGLTLAITGPFRNGKTASAPRAQ